MGRQPVIAMRLFALLPAVAVLAPTAPCPAQDTPFTIEQVLSAPMPSGLVASDGAVAWVENDRGVRNIWVATAPDFAGRRLTGHTRDDGLTLSDLSFTPDGSMLQYVRGDGPNAAGELPNPLSLADGTERVSWLIPVDGGEPRKLRDSGPVTFAPDGRSAVFAKGGDVWIMDPEEPDGAERLFTVRGGPGGFEYSPDGSKLAFESRRGDHSFVGVYAFADSALRWISPGVWLDGAVRWSPDGSRLVFLRRLSGPDMLFAPERETVPFSIRVADPVTAVSREIFRADPGPGSTARSWSGSPFLHWASGDRIVFPWEKNGWLQIWSVPAFGGEPVLLTPGDGEVQYVAITPDRTEMLFDSNVGDIDRKHLYRVAVDGSGPPRAVTTGDGIEWSAVATAGGSIAYLASDAITPAHAVILTRNGERRDLHPGWLPSGFPTHDLVVPEQVVFSASDGMMIHGQLFLPKSTGPGYRHPALLFFHGGSRRQMLLGFHHRGYYHNAYALNQYFASRGFVVLSVNYRSGIGYGLDFREALDYGATGASEFRDVTGAGNYLRAREDVDPDRIGLWGGSYGGYLTALGLARASDLFAAGVDFHGVHDWNVTIQGFRPSYSTGEHPEFAATAFASSPLADVDTWRSPVLLIHGDDDRNVPFAESVNLAYALSTRGVYFEELVFPDEVHGFLLHSSWVESYGATADFFRRMLLDGQAERLKRGG